MPMFILDVSQNGTTTKVSAYEKAEEILLRGDEDIDRPDLLSLVQTHHAQCILLGSSEEYSSRRELEGKELEEILFKLNE
ncbi:hypothetical protein L2E82_37241 [Cichorium intybus]|uniref:Uncharacterized protein n=1 Tax=Cichorium intybus TaxID=13427 RepID=A0ACB9AE71_CICIN|nr:hypothetical protein L2E82_37241 [Cichorium intybus]